MSLCPRALDDALIGVLGFRWTSGRTETKTGQQFLLGRKGTGGRGTATETHETSELSKITKQERSEQEEGSASFVKQRIG
jgi:hypothetical protein